MEVTVLNNPGDILSCLLYSVRGESQSPAHTLVEGVPGYPRQEYLEAGLIGNHFRHSPTPLVPILFSGGFFVYLFLFSVFN